MKKNKQAKSHIICYNLYKTTKCKQPVSYRNKIIWVWELEQEGGSIEGPEKTFGSDEYLHYVCFGDGFMGVCKYQTYQCIHHTYVQLIVCQLYLRRLFKKKQQLWHNTIQDKFPIYSRHEQLRLYIGFTPLGKNLRQNFNFCFHY